MSFVSADVINEAIMRDAVQKRGEFGRRTIPAPRLDDFAPNFLIQILGRIVMSGQTQQVAEQRVVVTLVQDAKRGNVTISVSEHEGRIFGGADHTHRISDA